MAHVEVAESAAKQTDKTERRFAEYEQLVREMTAERRRLYQNDGWLWDRTLRELLRSLWCRVRHSTR